jgi:hypothetical protein
MVALLLTTTISCSDAFKIINNITRVVGLSESQKTELIKTIQQSIPSCPVKVESNVRSKSNS